MNLQKKSCFAPEVLKPVELLMNHDEIRLSAKQRLKCYRVKDDNISVIDKQ